MLASPTMSATAFLLSLLFSIHCPNNLMLSSVVQALEVVLPLRHADHTVISCLRFLHSVAMRG